MIAMALQLLHGDSTRKRHTSPVTEPQLPWQIAQGDRWKPHEKVCRCWPTASTGKKKGVAQLCPIASLFFQFEVESGLYSSFSKIDSEDHLQKGQLFDDKNRRVWWFPKSHDPAIPIIHSFRTIPHRLMVAGDATWRVETFYAMRSCGKISVLIPKKRGTPPQNQGEQFSCLTCLMPKSLGYPTCLEKHWDTSSCVSLYFPKHKF